ncbi:pimeloyl-ACP methyl ester carboxylesterase [Duganella sp. 1411]|uniref:alpha/beta fold hydrolase n=1 Tax=Duganella sp. 1411 TaxID=2806572 RepID=UPI001AEA89DD|nr:alpha/beta hydrolase [Duganella sp. 1411]MBP1202374.1 pimeloyl-ACP methyl ester carboxylesterase [Duganella sp. 1411]
MFRWSGLLRLFRLWLTCALSLMPVFAVQAATPPMPNVVLVHGAFADGSSWAQVIALLQRKGYHVSTVQLPLTSLADDVAATRRVIERQSGDVILVGHSWAGVVVTEAANSPAVKGVVYLSAMVPDNGESAADMLRRFKSPVEGMKPDANGLIWLDDAVAFRNVMGADLPPATAQVLAAVGKPIAARSFTDAITHAAWHDKPTWYLITTDDHALPPAVQRQTAAQLNAQTMTLKSSHLSLMSHPRQVAELIGRAASGAAR